MIIIPTPPNIPLNATILLEQTSNYNNNNIVTSCYDTFSLVDHMLVQCTPLLY